MQALARLVKEGTLGRLEILNAGTNPDDAEKLGVRAVPWVRIGDFELSGARGYEELERWARSVDTIEGRSEYLVELLKSGGLNHAIAMIERDPAYVDALIPLVTRQEAELQVRLGVGALMEQLQGTRELAARVAPLAALTNNADARVRADACHYLALTRSPDAAAYIKGLLGDASPEVREIAAEGLAALAATASKS